MLDSSSSVIIDKLLPHNNTWSFYSTAVGRASYLNLAFLSAIGWLVDRHFYRLVKVGDNNGSQCAVLSVNLQKNAAVFTAGFMSRLPGCHLQTRNGETEDY